jgi:LPXTG-motif cell wall-anchored protein
MRRLGLSVAVTVLALAGTSAPASAGPSPSVPLVGVLVPEQVTVVDGHASPVTVAVVNGGTATAQGVVLQFGSAVRPVDAGAGLALPAGCDAQGCHVGDLEPGATRKYTVTLTPAAATWLTSTFDVTVGGAGGVLGYQAPVTVVRARGDLALTGIDDLTLNRGRSAAVPVRVRNAGTTPVDGFALIAVTEPGLQARADQGDCTPAGTVVTCRFARRLPAGATTTLPVRVSVAADAGGPHRYSISMAAVGVTGASGQSRTAAGPGRSGGPAGADAAAGFGVRVGSSPANVVAAGGSFDGASGDTATVQVGVRNVGPTGAVPPGLGWMPTVRVTIPVGVRLTGVDDDCVPGADTAEVDFGSAGTVGGTVYTCFVMTRLTSGADHLFTFTGKIIGGRQRAGSVVVDGGFQDGAAADDRAILGVRRINAGDSGGLPVTGAPTAWVALAGAVLLVIGLTVIKRRKVRVRVAPPR